MGLKVGGIGRGQNEQEFNGRDEGDVGIRMVLGSEDSQRRIGRDANGISIDWITGIHRNSLGSQRDPSKYWSLLGICSRLSSLIDRQVHP